MYKKSQKLNVEGFLFSVCVLKNVEGITQIRFIEQRHLGFYKIILCMKMDLEEQASLCASASCQAHMKGDSTTF